MRLHIVSIEELIKRLIERRKELGLSQAEVAKLCNLSINGISKFESNPGDREMKLSTILKLSQILGFKLTLDFEE